MVKQKILGKYTEYFSALRAYADEHFTSADVGIDGNVLEQMYNDGLLVRLGRTRIHRVWALKRVFRKAL
jgi:hypothetical protein